MVRFGGSASDTHYVKLSTEYYLREPDTFIDKYETKLVVQ